MFELFLLLWLPLCLVVGGVASAKNRNFIGWALLSLVISPFFAILALIAVPVRTVPARTEYFGHMSMPRIFLIAVAIIGAMFWFMPRQPSFTPYVPEIVPLPRPRPAAAR
jgi:hypothetical protein